jgi:hypothetical protein
MKLRRVLLSLCTAGGLLIAAQARADSLVPAQGQPGYDAALAHKADDYGRVIHAIMTPSLGWGLEADIGDPDNRRARKSNPIPEVYAWRQSRDSGAGVNGADRRGQAGGRA